MSNLIAGLESAAAAIPWPIVWLGACLGHAFLMTVSLNVLYADRSAHSVDRSAYDANQKKIEKLGFSAPMSLYLVEDDSWLEKYRPGTLRSKRVQCFLQMAL